MTWIKTISVEEDERVRHTVEAQRELYPGEYAVPVHPTADGQASQIVASACEMRGSMSGEFCRSH
jgi:hypothetical protein